MRETIPNGPIHSALYIAAHDEPHQVVLMDPRTLYTRRSSSGDYLAESVLLPQQSINALLNLQAYYRKVLVQVVDEKDDDFFLSWNIWMGITHKDLMNFLLEEQ